MLKKSAAGFSRLLPTILVLLAAVIFLFPLLIMLSSAFQTNERIFDSSRGLWPEHFALENFRKVFA
ncbi:MAG: carbohydrate ABC transporter permease, partial [Oribacterium sp.]